MVRWIDEIEQHEKNQRLDFLGRDLGDIPLSLVHLCTTTYHAGNIELFRATTSIRKSEDFNNSKRGDLLLELVPAVKKGEAYHWLPVRLLA
jgi:hypothetical protein